jgi:hypothetical protein
MSSLISPKANRDKRALFSVAFIPCGNIFLTQALVNLDSAPLNGKICHFLLLYTKSIFKAKKKIT